MDIFFVRLGLKRKGTKSKKRWARKCIVISVSIGIIPKGRDETPAGDFFQLCVWGAVHSYQEDAVGGHLIERY